jgi:RND superfamily putative drug exporter
MNAWTDAVIRHRGPIVAAWVVLLALGLAASSQLADVMNNRLSVPGAESERGRTLLKDRMGVRGDGTFILVAAGVQTPAERDAVIAALSRAAHAVAGGRPGPLRAAGSNGVVYADIATPLEFQDAAVLTPRLRETIGRLPGVATYLTGYPAINHDTQALLARDLRRGESIAIPIALLVTVFMFGTLGGLLVPFALAAVTIPVALGIVWLVAHLMDVPFYVTNIVALLGIAIAIDYSMLVVCRQRQEFERTDDPHEALRATMATAGRATLFSGVTVAVGLAVLALMPVPLLRAMGVGGLLVPVVAVAAAATLLPALLAILGRRIDRLPVLPRRSARPAVAGLWHRLASSIMRRPVPWLLCAVVLMLALAAPALQLSLTGGDNRGVPGSTESTRGRQVLAQTLGPGALVPHAIVVDTQRAGGASDPAVVAAQRRLVGELRRDPEIVAETIAAPALTSRWLAAQASLVDRDGRVLQIRAAGRSDGGAPAAMELVRRIRERYVPAARFPRSGEVLLTGAPAAGVDFVDETFGAFPWLVLAVLCVSYVVLLRAFRSLLLPLKAILMNLLSVGAAYGVLVLAFQHGWGSRFGLMSSPQIDGWVPVFLFAVLFGLSMDYEVFLLSRMREEWERRRDNQQAVAHGLEQTGRIITAAAIIMVAAFAGFLGGSFVSLQELGLGLAVAIALDATIVRAVLVPATMRLLGTWNWYLPAFARRPRLRWDAAERDSPP